MPHYTHARTHTHTHPYPYPHPPRSLCRLSQRPFACAAAASCAGLAALRSFPCRFVSCFSLGGIVLTKGSRGQVLRGEVTGAVFDFVGVGDTEKAWKEKQKQKQKEKERQERKEKERQERQERQEIQKRQKQMQMQMQAQRERQIATTTMTTTHETQSKDVKMQIRTR